MVNIDPNVRKEIGDYVVYLTGNFLCSPKRAKERGQVLFLHLYALDKPICTDKPSTHRSFGKQEGYLYGFFKDKNGLQWNYLYEWEKDTDIDEVTVLVHKICCGGLKDSLQYLSLTQVLSESLENSLAYEISQVL